MYPGPSSPSASSRCSRKCGPEHECRLLAAHLPHRLLDDVVPAPPARVDGILCLTDILTDDTHSEATRAEAAAVIAQITSPHLTFTQHLSSFLENMEEIVTALVNLKPLLRVLQPWGADKVYPGLAQFASCLQEYRYVMEYVVG
ncbi:hypothetical protein NDU88_002458 [Pleurodeles waltl]|uniref:Protein inscuteable homologue C-terminal domain-containing protein n=1 Tax=Pleurodeles waltl TaxID=8319 RepID=A0AAV7TNA0_PLEWA|nr:hypothetical protein NDU88_002458 [Pleurodeles waltl]